MKPSWVVVGLGNPEGRFNGTWHNIGFACLEGLKAELGIEFKKKGNQLLAQHEGTIFLMPLTYMNLSGQAVVAVARKYKIAPENIIVVCDDLYIDKGNIRLSIGGSGGGHNGLKSITELLGTAAYIRVRVGIAPTEKPASMANYVLSRVDKESEPAVNKAVGDARSAVLELVNGAKFEAVQGKYNVKNR